MLDDCKSLQQCSAVAAKGWMPCSVRAAGRARRELDGVASGTYITHTAGVCVAIVLLSHEAHW